MKAKCQKVTHFGVDWDVCVDLESPSMKLLGVFSADEEQDLLPSLKASHSPLVEILWNEARYQITKRTNEYLKLELEKIKKAKEVKETPDLLKNLFESLNTGGVYVR